MVFNDGMTTTKKILSLAIAISGIIPAATLLTTTTANAATLTCKDTNGTAPGGSVYLNYNTTVFFCNVVPPQRLHLTNTPNATACADAGGNYSPTTHICWDVDY